MRRKIVIVLLSLGTILGYAHGFRSLRHGGCHRERRQSFEQHVAALCVDAAKRGDATQAGAPPDENDRGHRRGHHGHRHGHGHGHGPWGWGPDHDPPTVDTTALRDPFAPGPAVAPVAAPLPVVVPAVPAAPGAAVVPAAPAVTPAP